MSVHAILHLAKNYVSKDTFSIGDVKSYVRIDERFHFLLHQCLWSLVSQAQIARPGSHIFRKSNVDDSLRV